MNKLTRKCVAAIASLAMAGTLCVAGAVTVASVAWAVPPVTQPAAASKAPWEQGAPDTGTLKIVKCDAKEETATGGAAATSSECPANHKPLKDVEFTVTKIDKIKVDNSDVTLNLKEYSSWQAISKIVTKLNTGDIAAGDLTLATTFETLKTDGNGKAEKTGLAIGLYKVEETKTPEGYGANDVQVFYMTLPLIEYKTEGNTTKTIYNYNPVVKPKNKDISKNITKTLDKSKTFAVVGDTIAYTISAEVNKSKPANGSLTKDDIQGFAVFDDAPTAAFASVTSDAVKKVKIGGEELKNDATNTYYNVSTITASDSNNADSKDLATGHTRILVKFTEAGLEKIAEKINTATGNNAPKVEVDLEFTISDGYKNTTAPEGDNASTDTTKEEIVNKSGFFAGHKKGETPTPPIIPDGGKSTVDFGYLQVDKYNSEDENKKLENAEFKLFTDKDKAYACSQGLMENKELANIDACKAASVSFDGKTNAEGKFQTPFKTIAGQVYLIESKAPEGYARTPEVHTVTITKNKTTVEKFANFPVKGGDDGNKFWFNLPATGAAGVILFAVAGIGLIFTSVFLYVRNRKEEQRA